MAVNNANKMVLALKLVGNDHEKARSMVAGDLKDVRVINGKFSIESAEIYTLFQLFFNIDEERLLNMSLVSFSDVGIYDKNKLTDNWKLFNTIIKQLAKTPTLLNTDEFKVSLVDSIEGYQLIYDVQEGEHTNLAATILEIVEKSYGLDGAECTVDLADLSSLDMVESKISINKEKSMGEAPDDDRPEIEQLAAHTIEGALLISPVKGKFIHDIQPGDIIKVQLINHDPISDKIATALGAFDNDRNFLPIRGRVKELSSLPTGGYRIYTLVAKNILARIIEEEDIKVELWDFSNNSSASKDAASKQLGLIILLAFFVIVALVIVAVIL